MAKRTLVGSKLKTRRELYGAVNK